PAGVRARVAEGVVLDQRIADLRLTIAARSQVDAGVVEAGRIDVVPESADRVRREDAVAGEEPVRVGGQVATVPAMQSDLTGPVPSVPPDLVPLLLLHHHPPPA